MSDSDLYSRLLFPKGHGYPLFHPQPFDDLPYAARRAGTEIGDVGLITQDGSFDPIFNILRAADDPSNRFGVPSAYEQVLLSPEDIAARALFHLPGSDISNTTITKRRLDVDAGIENNIFLPLGVGAVVEVSTDSKQTGLLLLPDGASRWDLRPQHVFRDYALKHAQNWYAFVNGSLHRMIGNGDLYLVTGVTKSTSWSVAAVENHLGEGKISLKLKAAQMGNAGASWAWEWESASSSVDSGPRRHPGEELWRDNQTVFLRGFKVALRSNPLRRAPKIRSIVGSKWSDMPSKGTPMPFSQPQSSVAEPAMQSPQPQSPGHNVDRLSRSPPSTTSSNGSASDESLSSSSNCYHPSYLINEYLLDSFIDAQVAVTHDDEWASVLSEEDSEVPDDKELIKRITDKFGMSLICGGVCLQSVNAHAKSPSTLARTSQDLLYDTNVEQHPFDNAVTRWRPQQWADAASSEVISSKNLHDTDLENLGPSLVSLPSKRKFQKLEDSGHAPAVADALGAGRAQDTHHTSTQKCLGCGATSTPEWRRGPLGPRTLCNACGLVYAKLVKKRLREDARVGGSARAANSFGGRTTGQSHKEESPDPESDEDDEEQLYDHAHMPRR